MVTAPETDQRLLLRDHPLVMVVGALAVGILLERHLGWHEVIWWGLSASAAGAWFLCRRWPNMAAALLLCALLGLAGCWSHLRWSCYHHDEIGRAAQGVNEPVCVKVIALSTPLRVGAPPPDPMRTLPQNDRTVVPVEVVGVRNRQQWQRASGQTTLQVEGHLLGVHGGDQLQVFAQLAAITSPGSPGEFNFAHYQRGQRMLSQLRATSPDCVERLEHGSPWSWRVWLDQVRILGRRHIRQYIAADQEDLAGGLLLGDRGAIPRDQIEAFRKTGTMHLLAISGLHVGLLAWFLLGLGRAAMLPRRYTLVLVMGVALVYALLADARPSVVRATILICVVAGGTLLRRPAMPFDSLAAAAILVLAFNPADLLHVGFQLSFLAVGTLLSTWRWYSKVRHPSPIDRLIRQTRPLPIKVIQWCWRQVLWWIIGGSAIWIVTLPLISYHFHLASPLGLVMNPLLALPMAGGLGSGFLVLLTGWICPPLANLAGELASGCLGVVSRLIDFTSDLPGSHFWMCGPHAGWMIGGYVGLAWLVAMPRWRPPRRWIVAASCGYLAVGVAVGPGGWLGKVATTGEPELQCNFISVGHGLCCVMELPNGQTLLYDAGRFGSPEMGVNTVSAFLWSKGITHLDAVVLSHADADHYNLLPQLLERFSVKVVYVSPVMFRRPSPALIHLREAIVEAGIPIKEIYRGDRLASTERVTIDVLHPSRRGRVGGDNANSVVLAVTHANRRLLLTGDLEPPGLSDVLDEMPLDCDVVLAPHHGSAGSDPTRFTEWCNPEWVIISGGRGRTNRNLAARFSSPGREVLHTAEQGTIEVSISPEGIEVRPYRQPTAHDRMR